MAYLYRDSFQGRVTVIVEDEFARFMWIWVIGVSPIPRDLYFAPTSSNFALHRDSDEDLSRLV
jgi:hypothetical protein